MEAKILAVGDVVGRNGLEFLAGRLRKLKNSCGADFVSVNGENASGVGITPRQAEMILDSGADIITLGNHAFQKNEIFDMLDDSPYLLRPHNFAPQSPGTGYRTVETRFGPVLIMNLIGRCEMDFGPDNPFHAADRILKETGNDVRVRLLDFHAEASSEKLAMGYYLDGRVSAVWGTHTHVQTSDCGVLPKGTGFICDLGMTGPKHSVLGVEPEQSIRMFLGYPKQKYTTAGGSCKLEAALFTVDSVSGRCLAAESIRIEE